MTARERLLAALTVSPEVRPGEAEQLLAAVVADSRDEQGTHPLVVRWDRAVIHPEVDPSEDTIVCCLAEGGLPVALLLDDEHREALGSALVDPTGETEFEAWPGELAALRGTLAAIRTAAQDYGGSLASVRRLITDHYAAERRADRLADTETGDA